MIWWHMSGFSDMGDRDPQQVVFMNYANSERDRRPQPHHQLYLRRRWPVPRQNPIQPGAAPDLTSRRRHQRRFQWREGLFGIRK